MKFRQLFRVELGRLLCGRLTWLTAGATALAPLAGYSFYRPTFGDSMSALYLANPMVTGGLAGTVLFALLMLVNLDRPRRNGTAALIETAVSPVAMNTARLLSVFSLALLVSLAAGILYLPYTVWKLNIVFSLNDYVLAVILFFLSGPVMGALAAAIAVQLTDRLDVSILAVLTALIISRGQWCNRYFLTQWSVPLVPTMSDAFGSAVVWRTACYSRFVWLCILSGFWLLSLLCVRQYGRSALGAFVWRARRPILPASAVLLLAAGILLWQNQPFMDHSPENWTEYEREDRFNDSLKIAETNLNVKIDPHRSGSLSGEAVYRLINRSGRPQELYFELNSGYRIHSVTANGIELPFKDLKNDYIASRELLCTLPADKEITFVITYGGMPRLWREREQQLSGSFISRSGISLASKNLAPTLQSCALVENDAVPATLEISMPESLTPVSTGSVQRLSKQDGTVTWRLTDRGTERFQFYAGDYVSAELHTGTGMPILFYYSKKYQSRLDGGAIDLMEQAVAYCAAHYGPRSFTQDKPFRIVQLTAFEFGGFANRNISGMGESYFSDENLSDPDKGAGSAEILAHEIIHQWWGLGATLYDPEDEDWSDEGITVYTTYRLMAERMGEEYARENYVNQWMDTMADQQASFYRRHPEYLDRLPERYANEIRASHSGANGYDGNALLIYRAAQKLGADYVDEVWSKLYIGCASGEISEITMEDFLQACGLKKGEIGRE